MKRATSILLTFCLLLALALCLCGCGGGQNDTPVPASEPAVEGETLERPDAVRSETESEDFEPYQAPEFNDSAFHEDEAEGEGDVKVDLSAVSQGYVAVSVVSANEDTGVSLCKGRCGASHLFQVCQQVLGSQLDAAVLPVVYTDSGTL